tara:strand:- start:1176 stop:2123 length:948 start_codon:yes stop_codon:yes gene_type:complete
VNYWHNKRILVTGGTGFLGSVLVSKLAGQGASAVITPGSNQYDLRESEDVERMFKESRPDLVFHLAAVVGGIGANRSNPGKLFYDNAIMGIQVIEHARRACVGKTLIVGTICSYPKYTSIPFRESEFWDGYPEETNAAYGLAKKMLLVQAQAYRQQYGMDIINVLPVNLYGPGDNFDLESSHVIPALIRKYVEARDSSASEVTLWGTGKATREFLYVDDAAEAILLAMGKYDSPDPVNLGSGEEVSIRDLSLMIGNAVGFSGHSLWDTSKPDGQPRRNLDTTKAREEFGFVSSVSLSVGLDRTIEWYIDNRHAIK